MSSWTLESEVVHSRKILVIKSSLGLITKKKKKFFPLKSNERLLGSDISEMSETQLESVKVRSCTIRVSDQNKSEIKRGST